MKIAAYIFSIISLLGLTVYFATIAVQHAWLSAFEGANIGKLRLYFWITTLLALASFVGAILAMTRLREHGKIENDSKQHITWTGDAKLRRKVFKFAIAALLVLAIGLLIWRELEISSCLDLGGRWDYDNDVCEGQLYWPE